MGIPSMSMVNAMAFLIRDMSDVNEGNRTLSWFSRKDPRSVVSLHVVFIVLIPLTRPPISPLVDWKALEIQYHLSYQ